MGDSMVRHGSGDVSPELSRPIVVARVSEEGERFRLKANAQERAALAKRFDLVDLPSLEAEGDVTVFDHGQRARVEGIVHAHVIQSCVVTLAPVEADIEERFVRAYASSIGAARNKEIVVNVDEDEPPDPIVGGAVDIGEAVAETLGLALDPYPRAPEAELPLDGTVSDSPKGRAGGPEAGEPMQETPFSALKGLLKKR
jgi:uncharacterized metal-binding protein YceD (DUF177 family)